jgi:hypothetical protein
MRSVTSWWTSRTLQVGNEGSVIGDFDLQTASGICLKS